MCSLILGLMLVVLCACSERDRIIRETTLAKAQAELVLARSTSHHETEEELASEVLADVNMLVSSDGRRNVAAANQSSARSYIALLANELEKEKAEADRKATQLENSLKMIEAELAAYRTRVALLPSTP